MSKKIITHNNGVVETRETFYTEETIQQLRHQLEQAQTRISELEDKDWYQANIKQLEEQNDRLIQERDNLKQQLANKMEELHIAYCSIEDVKTKNGELKARLEEKDKEIEELKQNNKIFMQLIEETKSENIDDFAFLVRVTNGSYIQKLRKANRRVQELERLQTQLAIQELSEVERLLYESRYKRIGNKYYVEYEDINSLIDSRIKALEELKGE